MGALVAAGAAFCARIARAAKLAVFFDDYNRIHYPPGVVVNGSIGAETLPYPRDKAVKYCLGPAYIPLREEFRERRKKPLRRNIRGILITFGGTDTGGLGERLAAFLRRPGGPKIVVFGAGKRFSAAAVRRAMLASDVCVTGCGQTTYELASCGVPAVGVGFAGNQKLNIKGWVKNGSLLFAGWKGDKGLFNRIEALLSELTFSKRLAMSRRGRLKVDGLGARRIADAVRRAFAGASHPAFRLRPAAGRDCRNIFELSNSPAVRANSINTAKIRWAVHKRWFAAKIEDPRHSFLVAETPSGEFIGQLRYDVPGPEALVSFSISDAFRGRGLAAPLLAAGSARLFTDFPGVRRINAYIRPENGASIKAFERAGYKFERSEKINALKMRKYAAKRKNRKS